MRRTLCVVLLVVFAVLFSSEFVVTEQGKLVLNHKIPSFEPRYNEFIGGGRFILVGSHGPSFQVQAIYTEHLDRYMTWNLSKPSGYPQMKLTSTRSLPYFVTWYYSYNYGLAELEVYTIMRSDSTPLWTKNFQDFGNVQVNIYGRSILSSTGVLAVTHYNQTHTINSWFDVATGKELLESWALEKQSYEFYCDTKMSDDGQLFFVVARFKTLYILDISRHFGAPKVVWILNTTSSINDFQISPSGEQVLVRSSETIYFYSAGSSNRQYNLVWSTMMPQKFSFVYIALSLEHAFAGYFTGENIKSDSLYQLFSFTNSTPVWEVAQKGVSRYLPIQVKFSEDGKMIAAANEGPINMNVFNLKGLVWSATIESLALASVDIRGLSQDSSLVTTCGYYTNGTNSQNGALLVYQLSPKK